MSVLSAWQQERRLIPRWRTFTETLLDGELASKQKQDEGHKHPSPEFLKRLKNWCLTPNLVTAAEIVEASIVENRESEALDAARRLVITEHNATAAIRRQAASLLKRNGIPLETINNTHMGLSHQPLRERAKLQININDSLTWVDLAFRQTFSGRSSGAKRSMLVALGLSPNNRHVLRSAARLFVHLGDPERAHDILLRSSATKYDPWLLAAEISVSELASRTPKNVKTGSAFLEEGKFSLHQTSELAGALATLEIGGNRKKMRRLFRHSMQVPTGNSLAQAAWATPITGIDLVPVGHTLLGEHEAPAHMNYNLGKFEDALDSCLKWIQVEPFATRPYEFAAATAGVVEEFQRAIDLADEGLRLSPKSDRLRLSKGFALASIGKLPEAKALIGLINRAGEDKSFECFKIANQGLIAFREGENERARQLYLEAIQGFRSLRDANNVACAAVFMAREAYRANDPYAWQIWTECQDFLARTPRAIVANFIFLKTHKELGMPENAFSKKLQSEIGIQLPRLPPQPIGWSTPNFSGVLKLPNN